MAIKIHQVKRPKDRNKFISFPYKLHSNEKNWVPPLITEVKSILDSNANPFFEHSEMEFFLAYENGKLLGRIAAIIDENYIDVRKEAVGLFGFFDSVNRKDVAKALFNTASRWLREKGMVKILGPTNPSMNDEIGILIEGFDLPPAIKMVWNPPYYPELFEAAGFYKAIDIYAYNLTEDMVSERLKKIGEMILKRTKINLRNPNFKEFDKEIRIFRRLYNEAWSDNWGFVPWTEAEFVHVAKSLKKVLDPSLVFIAELDGEPVGFSIAIPDLNYAIKRTNGRLFPLGLLKILWYSRKIHRLRIAILGVKKQYRNRGVDTAMYYETWRVGTGKGYDGCEMSWVLENNEKMNKAAQMMGAEKYKTYRLYERKL